MCNTFSPLWNVVYFVFHIKMKFFWGFNNRFISHVPVICSAERKRIATEVRLSPGITKRTAVVSWYHRRRPNEDNEIISREIFQTNETILKWEIIVTVYLHCCYLVWCRFRKVRVKIWKKKISIGYKNKNYFEKKINKIEKWNPQ